MCLLHTQASLKLCCCLGFKSRLVRENLSRADRFSVYVQTVLALLAHSALASGHKTVLQQLLPWVVSSGSFRCRAKLLISFRINPDTSLSPASGGYTKEKVSPAGNSN